MKNSVKLMMACVGLMSIANLSAASGSPMGMIENPVPTKAAAALVLQEREDVVYLNLLNLDQNTVTIKVRDGRGRLIFAESLENTAVVQKTLNFKKAYKGTYTVKVTDGTKKYAKEISIK